eukprot:c16903_g1_i1.p1 GENE.c16903_g1_i1~~c16903_g1_i1.p1  ORF type:complete len:523 (-),score=154.33 c16903_g1_i1:37-1605(-)
MSIHLVRSWAVVQRPIHHEKWTLSYQLSFKGKSFEAPLLCENSNTNHLDSFEFDLDERTQSIEALQLSIVKRTEQRGEQKRTVIFQTDVPFDDIYREKQLGFRYPRNIDFQQQDTVLVVFFEFERKIPQSSPTKRKNPDSGKSFVTSTFSPIFSFLKYLFFLFLKGTMILGLLVMSVSFLFGYIERNFYPSITEGFYDFSDMAVCRFSGYRCPPREPSSIEKMMTEMEGLQMTNILELPKTVNGAANLLSDQITHFVDFGVDEEWEGFLFSARKLAQKYRQVEKLAFKAILKTRSFCEYSRNSIVDILDHIERNELNEAKAEILSIERRIAEAIASFDASTTLLEEASEDSNSLIEDATKLHTKFSTVEYQLSHQKSFQWVNGLLLAAAAGTCIATGGLVNPLCITAIIGQFGGGATVTYLDRLTEDEIKEARFKAEKYKISKNFIILARQNLEQYRKKLEEFHHYVEDSSGAVSEFHGALHGQRTKLRKKADTARNNFDNIVKILTDYIDDRTGAAAFIGF